MREILTPGEVTASQYILSLTRCMYCELKLARNELVARQTWECNLTIMHRWVQSDLAILHGVIEACTAVDKGMQSVKN